MHNVSSRTRTYVSSVLLLCSTPLSLLAVHRRLRSSCSARCHTYKPVFYSPDPPVRVYNTRTYVQAYNVGMETYLFQSAVGDLAVLCGRACELTRVSCNLNDEREEELALGDVEVNVLL